MRPTAVTAFRNLAISPQNRALLALDGGGIRGMLTLQLLKALEDSAQTPCHRLFDLLSGTSTGAIIATLLASGRSAAKVEDLYKTLVGEVFLSRSPFANQFVNPPKWSKANVRRRLFELFENTTLEQLGESSGLDIVLTARDATEGEETFFSYLQGRRTNVYGKVLVRAAVEASMSAPTYFAPLERFLDGGVTTHNCPALATVLEAVQYGDGAYNLDQLTLFSFGTGCSSRFLAPEQVRDPQGIDAVYWLTWLLSECGNDSSDMQDDILRACQITHDFDYRRFQLSLDPATLSKLPDLSLLEAGLEGATRLSELTSETLGSIALDDVGLMPLLGIIGEATVRHLKERARRTGQPLFGADLVDAAGNDALITRSGDTKTISEQMSSPEWLDAQPVE